MRVVNAVKDVQQIGDFVKRYRLALYFTKSGARHEGIAKLRIQQT